MLSSRSGRSGPVSESQTPWPPASPLPFRPTSAISDRDYETAPQSGRKKKAAGENDSSFNFLTKKHNETMAQALVDADRWREEYLSILRENVKLQHQLDRKHALVQTAKDELAELEGTLDVMRDEYQHAIRPLTPIQLPPEVSAALAAVSSLQTPTATAAATSSAGAAGPWTPSGPFLVVQPEEDHHPHPQQPHAHSGNNTNAPSRRSPAMHTPEQVLGDVDLSLCKSCALRRMEECHEHMLCLQCANPNLLPPPLEHPFATPGAPHAATEVPPTHPPSLFLLRKLVADIHAALERPAVGGA